MIYLLIAICCTSAFSIILKLIGSKSHAPTIFAMNYAVGGLFGIAYLLIDGKLLSSYQETFPLWRFLAGIIGVLFVITIIVNKRVIQEQGLALSQISSRLGFTLLVVFAYFFLKETMSFAHRLSIGSAMIAIVLCSSRGGLQKSQEFSLDPLYLVLGSGSILISFACINKIYHIQNQLFFTTVVFLVATSCFFVLSFFQNYKLSFQSIDRRSVGFGIILGIVNFFSNFMYGLALKSLPASFTFTLSNVSSLLLVSLVGLRYFRESYSKQQWLGFLFGCIAIVFYLFTV